MKKQLLIWKSKTDRDSYRIIWEISRGFTASYNYEDEWKDAEVDATAEHMIEWIISGDVKKDIITI